MSTNELHFSITGEFITEQVRDLFWNCDKDYDVCEEILLSILNPVIPDIEQNRKTAQDIIEGRMQFVGTDDLDLIPDNRNIRPLSLKIKQNKKALTVMKIKEHMRQYPMSYIDKYATKKSIRCAPQDDFNPNYLERIYHYFSTVNYRSEGDYYLPNYEDGTCLGLWLFEESDLIYDLIQEPITSNNQEDFFKELHQHIADHPDRLLFQGPGFAERQARYEAEMRMKIDKKREMRDWEEATKLKIKNRDRSQIKPREKDIDDMTLDEFGELLKNRDPDSCLYDIYPDDLINFEGLIAPDGKFYSCEFGGHNIKSYHVMQAYYSKFKYRDKDGKLQPFVRRSQIDEHTRSLNALDLLLENGWIATRYNNITGANIAAKMDSNYSTTTVKLTKAQKNTAWDVIIKHDIKLQAGTDLIL